MTAYKYAGLPSQLWASLTPISETWPLKTLLDELSAEAEAFKNFVNIIKAWANHGNLEADFINQGVHVF